MRLTPSEGVTLYPSDHITISLVHEHWLARLLRLPDAKVKLVIDRSGRLHVYSDDVEAA